MTTKCSVQPDGPSCTFMYLTHTPTSNDVGWFRIGPIFDNREHRCGVRITGFRLSPDRPGGAAIFSTFSSVTSSPNRPPAKIGFMTQQTTLMCLLESACKVHGYMVNFAWTEPVSYTRTGRYLDMRICKQYPKSSPCLPG